MRVGGFPGSPVSGLRRLPPIGRGDGEAGDDRKELAVDANPAKLTPAGTFHLTHELSTQNKQADRTKQCALDDVHAKHHTGKNGLFENCEGGRVVGYQPTVRMIVQVYCPGSTASAGGLVIWTSRLIG